MRIWQFKRRWAFLFLTGAIALVAHHCARAAVPGMAHYCDFNPNIPMSVNVVKMDRAQSDLALYVSLGGGNGDQIGTSILSRQATSIPPAVGTPLAGINGDYFNVRDPYAGDPMNLQIMMGGDWGSEPGLDRAFFYLDAKGQPHITNVVSQFKVTWPDGRTLPMGLNQTPMPGQAILYTKAAGSNTRVEGVDLILGQNGKEPWQPLRISQTLTAEVKAINRNGFTKITPGAVVLSLSPRQLKSVPELKVGMIVKLSTATTPSLAGATLALGGGPTLVRDGKIRDFDDDHFKHPRAAFGWNDKFYFLVQVDGRQARHSMGMTLRELAQYFVKLGATDALNVDGGASATMWVNGRIVNRPSQGRERNTANSLFVIRKK